VGDKFSTVGELTERPLMPTYVSMVWVKLSEVVAFNTAAFRESAF
jgi:hypothetical protein